MRVPNSNVIIGCGFWFESMKCINQFQKIDWRIFMFIVCFLLFRRAKKVFRKILKTKKINLVTLRKDKSAETFFKKIIKFGV